MDIKYNEVLGEFVNTANNKRVSQEELLQWAKENPMPVEQKTPPNYKYLNDLIQSLTDKETIDNTVQQGVETMSEKG
jgi:ABC-type uncharacterized transport system YnjBCD substrate-binding protein